MTLFAHLIGNFFFVMWCVYKALEDRSVKIWRGGQLLRTTSTGLQLPLTHNGYADVMEAKWKSRVSSECDLNLCLLLPTYAV